LSREPYLGTTVPGRFLESPASAGFSLYGLTLKRLLVFNRLARRFTDKTIRQATRSVNPRLQPATSARQLRPLHPFRLLRRFHPLQLSHFFRGRGWVIGWERRREGQMSADDRRPVERTLEGGETVGLEPSPGEKWRIAYFEYHQHIHRTPPGNQDLRPRAAARFACGDSSIRDRPGDISRSAVVRLPVVITSTSSTPRPVSTG